jgi:hypothetical protein
MKGQNFIYSTTQPDIFRLQSIKSEFHIYGLQEGKIHGLVRFSAIKTLSAAKKIIGYPTSLLETDIRVEQEKISRMTDVYKKGDMKEQKTVEEDSDISSVGSLSSVEESLSIVDEETSNKMCVHRLCQIISTQDKTIKELQQKIEKLVNKDVLKVMKHHIKKNQHIIDQILDI